METKEVGLGLMDWLKGGRKEADSNDALRRKLFDAIARGDQATLARLAESHTEGIVTAFEAWRTVPQALRTQPDRVQWYGNGMVGVARFFAERRNDSRLLAVMGGGAQAAQGLLGRADAFLAELDYPAATEVLLQALEPLPTAGSDADCDMTRAMILGRLAAAYFHGGMPAAAVAPMADAQQLCARLGDIEGTRSYLEGLYEIHRYQAQHAAAAEAASLRAEVDDDPEVIAYWLQAARSVGPLVRVMVVVEDRHYAPDQVPPDAEHIQFVFVRDRITLRPAQVAMERGRTLGTEGRTEEALRAFRDAAQHDPCDPDPHYQAGVALMTLNRVAEAVASFAACETLVPGWFQCRSDLSLAEAILAGRQPARVWEILRVLEGGGDPTTLLRIAEAAFEGIPEAPTLALALGKCRLAMGDPEGARTAFEHGLAADPEPDVASRLFVQRAGVEDDPEARRALLVAAQIPETGNRTAAAMATVFLRVRAANE